jgi:hypothetical protein
VVHKSIQQIDAKIMELKEKIAVLDRALNDPDLYRKDAGKAANFAKLWQKLADTLEEQENAWLEAHENAEKAL